MFFLPPVRGFTRQLVAFSLQGLYCDCARRRSRTSSPARSARTSGYRHPEPISSRRTSAAATDALGPPLLRSENPENYKLLHSRSVASGAVLPSDVYTHEVHRTMKHIVEWVSHLGSHQDFFGVGDRARRAPLRVGFLTHPRHDRVARLYAR